MSKVSLLEIASRGGIPLGVASNVTVTGDDGLEWEIDAEENFNLEVDLIDGYATEVAMLNLEEGPFNVKWYNERIDSLPIKQRVYQDGTVRTFWPVCKRGDYTKRPSKYMEVNHVQQQSK